SSEASMAAHPLRKDSAMCDGHSLSRRRFASCLMMMLGVLVIALAARPAAAQGTTCDLPTSVTATPGQLNFSSALTGPITVIVFAASGKPLDIRTATAPQLSVTLPTPLPVGSTDTVQLADAACTRTFTVTVAAPCPPLPTAVDLATPFEVIFNGTI